MSSDLANDLMTLESAKAQLLQEAFGKDKAEQVQELRKSLAKTVFEARKAQLEAQKPIYEKRKDVVKGVENFWPLVLQKSSLSESLEENDIEALKHLQDVSITYSTSDPREYDITFTFDGAKNPYFSDATLTKSFTVPEAVKKDGGEFDLEAPTETKAVSISWKDDKHNLVKKSPRPDMSKIESYDEFEGMGSFFNFFTAEEDQLNQGGLLETIYESALDVFAGFAALEDGDDDDEMDSDDEESDENGDEVDLGDSETDMPKKKRSRK